MSDKLTPEQLRELEEVFKVNDARGQEFFQQPEVRQFYEQQGRQPPSPLEMMKEYDDRRRMQREMDLRNNPQDVRWDGDVPMLIEQDPLIRQARTPAAARPASAPPRAGKSPAQQVAYVRHPSGYVVPIIRSPDMSEQEWTAYAERSIDPALVQQGAQSPRTQRLQGDFQKLRQGYHQTSPGLWERSDPPVTSDTPMYAYPEGDVRSKLPMRPTPYSEDLLQFFPPPDLSQKVP